MPTTLRSFASRILLRSPGWRFPCPTSTSVPTIARTVCLRSRSARPIAGTAGQSDTDCRTHDMRPQGPRLKKRSANNKAVLTVPHQRTMAHTTRCAVRQRGRTLIITITGNYLKIVFLFRWSISEWSFLVQGACKGYRQADPGDIAGVAGTRTQVCQLPGSNSSWLCEDFPAPEVQ